jgi:squalene-hopene/tetraprenyl-beta-curcumene cyclase
MTEVLEPRDQARVVAMLLAAQRPDGGWSMASLVDNVRDPTRQTDEGQTARGRSGYGEDFLIFVGRDKVYQSSLASDAYATGLVIYVLRQANLAASDERIQRGISWLKTHQRESGRWFTPSQGWHKEHRIANTGTAYALIALHACDEIPKP